VFADTSDNVDEVNCPRFLFVRNNSDDNNLKHNIMKKILLLMIASALLFDRMTLQLS